MCVRQKVFREVHVGNAHVMSYIELLVMGYHLNM